MTLQEISDYFGVSKERIRQIEQKALKALKKSLYKRGITKYSDISIGEVFQFSADHDIHGGKYK